MSALTIEDIGEIGPEFLVFGGPYSNLQATNALFDYADAAGLGAGQLICTGDAVAYCGDPAGVVERLDGQCHWIAGNCEKQLVAGADDCGCGFEDGTQCDMWSAQWYARARAALSAQHLKAMAKCPDLLTFTTNGLRAVVLHGGVSDVARFLWPTDPVAAFQSEIDAVARLCGPVDLVFAGHAGLVFERQIGPVRWLNAGVIGMPAHDGTQATRFIHWTAGAHAVRRLEYDHVGAAASAVAGGYPQPYARALSTGLWPSEDVLPEALRR